MINKNVPTSPRIGAKRSLAMEYRVALALVFVALFAKEALAAQHSVGGSQGWDESTDFSSWASGQKFKVGDQLGMCLLSLTKLGNSIFGTI